MSRYILNNSTFTKLDDPPAIVENISGYRVEIYYNPTDTTGVTLYPYQSMPYTTPIWARRELGEAGTAVVATIPYTGNGSGNGNTSGSYYLDYDDDYCGGGGDNNVNICVNTHTGTYGQGCCCDTATTVIQPATLPSCDCHSDSDSDTLPAEICDCNGDLAITIPSGNSKRRNSFSKGDVNIKMPIVINIPNYFPPNQVNCCPNGNGSNNNSSTPQIADSSSSTDNLSDIDKFFEDKTKEDDGDTSNLDAIDDFFNDKEQ